MRRAAPDRAQRLRSAVDALPRRTRLAMLTGIVRNRIVVGAYADPRTGGVCPMLAAHRNGGRTNFASFARAWDAFTSARRPRLATRHELGVLRSYLEFSLLRDEHGDESIAGLAAGLRAERGRAAEGPGATPGPASKAPAKVPPNDETGPIRIRRVADASRQQSAAHRPA
jgi:hypothetical protein